MPFWDSTWKWAGALAFAAGCAVVQAAPVKTDHVTAELVAEREGVQPGQSLQIGLRLQHIPHWHTYWRNPGDSGLPTTLQLTLPPGAQAGAIDWPAPKRLPIGPLVNYGYEGELLLPLRFTAPADAKVGAVLNVRAEASWLVCKDVCIPENASLTLRLPVIGGSAAASSQAALFERTVAAQAVPLSGWTAQVQRAGRDVLLTLDRSGGAATATALPPIDVFPYAEQTLEPARHEVLRTATGYAVKLGLVDGADLPATLSGIAVAGEVASAWAAGRRAVEFQAPVRSVAAITLPPEAAALSATGPATTATSPLAGATTVAGESAGLGTGLLAALALALVGGMVLNLMPCVFPVLSIKLLSLAQQDERPRALRLHALAYGAGVVGTFIALAAGLLTLRAAGSAVGWGFQLQEPGVVFLLALLFFGLGLNLIGAFEFGNLLPQRLVAWRSRRPAGDAFACGVVAVVAASPCTAPFMGAALGYAVTQSAGAALAVFAMLGIGMALPYTLLVMLPGWRRALPRPGAWMNRLKQGLAFPMFATVVWLLWVLGQQAGLDAAVKTLFTLLGVAFVLWIAGVGGSRGRGARVGRSIAAVAGLVALFAWSWPTALTPENARLASSLASGQKAGPWLPYDDTVLAQRVAEGKPVFVDFTSAWCVSCQVNKRLVLERAETLRAFADAGVTLMRADWTHRDAKITAALARLGRNGVPVYVLMRPGREPLLLPEILTRRVVVDAIATLGPEKL